MSTSVWPFGRTAPPPGAGGEDRRCFGRLLLPVGRAERRLRLQHRGMSKRVAIVGGGFGGLAAAKGLGKLPVEVTLVDRVNYHLFQPLLYQVAMAGLSPADIAVPIRSALHRKRNVRVILDEALAVNLARRQVALRNGAPLSFDYLVLAAGAGTHYFGHPEWSRWAIGLKDLNEAVEIRRRVLLAFEAAEREADPAKRRDLLRFVVIGGGPTGVELAGALAELARFVVARDFRRVQPEEAEVLLLEAGPRILLAFDPDLSERAVRQLRELGVKVRTGAMVTKIDEVGVHLGDEAIPASCVIWGAGVRPRPLGATLGVPLDAAGRVIVGPDCSVPGHPNVFVIGDMAHFPGPNGRPLPGLAPVAMQQGRHVAAVLRADLEGKRRPSFRYRDKGIMATIGRSRAVAQKGRMRLAGLLAWLAWIVVHLWFLVGFRNRFLVFYNWVYNYFTYKRGARLITGRRLLPGVPEQVVEPSEVERIAAPRERAERGPPAPDALR